MKNYINHVERINILRDKLVKGLDYINISEIKPHEEVIKERKNQLIKYLGTNLDQISIQSIVVDDKSKTIIDGHHRFHALKELGYSMVPITKIDYFDDSIITHYNPNLSLSKEEIVSSANRKELLHPKSTIHQIRYKNQSYPIIILSSITII